VDLESIVGIGIVVLLDVASTSGSMLRPLVMSCSESVFSAAMWRVLERSLGLLVSPWAALSPVEFQTDSELDRMDAICLAHRRREWAHTRVRWRISACFASLRKHDLEKTPSQGHQDKECYNCDPNQNGDPLHPLVDRSGLSACLARPPLPVPVCLMLVYALRVVVPAGPSRRLVGAHNSIT